MYCNHCGTEVPEGGNFCPSCGRTVSLAHAGRHVEPYRSIGGAVFGAVVGILFGLSLISGGIYSIVHFIDEYAKWAVAGSVPLFLAGASCIVTCICTIYRTVKRRK